MRKLFIFFFLLLVSTLSFSQQDIVEKYDACAEEIDAESKRQFKKAYSYYKDGKLDKAFPLLKELIENDSDFASPYFLMGMIGVARENTKMIEKYFPLVREVCSDYSHPLMFYYLGVIDYSYNRFDRAVVCFERFLDETLHDNNYSKMQTTAINYIKWCEFLSLSEKDKYPFLANKIERISTEQDETKPFLSLDEQTILFVRKVKQRSKNEESFYQQTSFTTKDVLCQAFKEYDEDLEIWEFDAGFSIRELENTLNKPTKVSMTADKKQMYLSFMDKTTGKYQIYCSKSVDGVWSEPENIGNIVNLSTANQIDPFITVDGNTLYFSSDRNSGQGGYDIWVTHKSKNGSWLKPTNLGKRINTPRDEFSSYLHPDNKSFYFSSNGWKGFGGQDLFYINLNEITMKEPLNIGQEINTEGNENEIMLKKDGKTAYRSQWDSIAKNYNIVFYELPEKCRAKSAHLLNLSLIDKQMPAYNCKIDVINLTENASVSYYTPSDEEKTFLALMPYDKYLIKIEKPSYAFCCKAIQVPKDLDSLSIEIKMLQSGEVYPLENDRLFLDEFVQYLKENPRLRIQLLGKEEEATQVKEYLLKSGLREDRVRLCTTQSSETLSYIID